MDLKKDPADPSTTSMAYDAMLPKWAMVDALLGGTAAMREAGETYLPRHQEETQDNYAARLSNSVLFNYVEMTLDHLVGKVFSDPIEERENKEVPEKLEPILEDVDTEKNDVNTFSRMWFREGMAKGFCHVLIDMPPLPEADRVNRTLADDQRDGRRPYWILIKPEKVISMSVSTQAGKEFLTEVRIYECVIEKNGFAEAVQEQIRVLEPGRFTVYEKIEKPKQKNKIEWRVSLDKSGETGIDFIPLVTFYATREGVTLCKPPLEDLCYLNIRHWQSYSDQMNILTVSRFPMLAVSGIAEQFGSDMKIGPRQLLGVKEPNGRFYYVEHGGKAIDSGRQDLQDLEEAMSAYGAEMLKKRPGNRTATARALDSAESTSILQDIAIRFNDALNLALYYTGKWMSVEEVGELAVPTDFGPEDLKEVDLRTLSEARRNRDISRKAYLLELKRRGLLSDEFEPKSDIAELLAEEETLPLGTPPLGNNVRQLTTKQGRPSKAEDEGTGDA